MGFFAGLEDEKYDRQYTDRELTRRIIDFFRTQVSRLVYSSIIIIMLFVGLFAEDFADCTFYCFIRVF